MIVGIYNFKPKEGCYLADFMAKKHFILDTDKYSEWLATEFVQNKGVCVFDKLVAKLLKMLLARRGYTDDGCTWDWTVLELKDGKYIDGMGQKFFDDAVWVENITPQEQMDIIYKNISPIIMAMSEAYPDSTAHPVFKFDCDSRTNEIKVTLSEINFTIGK